MARPQEPFGVTSIVMGHCRQNFTIVVSRVESDGRTAFTTIIQKSNRNLRRAYHGTNYELSVNRSAIEVENIPVKVLSFFFLTS